MVDGRENGSLPQPWVERFPVAVAASRRVANCISAGGDKKLGVENIGDWEFRNITMECNSSIKSYFVNVKIEQVLVKMEFDSGAGISILPLKLFITL